MTTADVPGGDAGRDLYGLPPSEFTAARNSLAKQLQAAGDKAEAALVAKLRRPPSTAWALNRVARERPAAIEGVVDAGETLRAATEKALAGDASSLRTAQAVERRAVEGAIAVAAGFLAEAGLGAGDGPRQRMAGTLRAAMVDETVDAALRAGVLDDDRDAPGFGLAAFSAAAPGSATRRRAPARARRGAATAAVDEGATGTRAPSRKAPARNAEPTTDDGAEPAGSGAAEEAAADATAQEAAAADERQEAARAAAVEARQRADRLAAAASEAERDEASARDAAAAARAEAEAAAARARRAAAAADAARTSVSKAREAAADAAAEAERAERAVGRA